MQDYVSFIPPPQFYRGERSEFSPSIEDCWYGRVALLFNIHVRTDAGSVMSCKCALMETLWDYCPGQTRPWWQSTAQIGSRMIYLPEPKPMLWIVPISHILSRLPLIPAGDTGTIPADMAGTKQANFPHGVCDNDDAPGSGSQLFHINSWAMVFPSDHRKLDQ